ncbi:Rpn family recombination-promoting nuclease/putative transposase [Ligilactobacillus faecis]|uniref:Rpn family recombination-promoting nuclease/putative transposase n=1 Tax=Ligilactobacillus faecis TaxID=762833 RepID=A0ABV4DRP5_9LACO
MDKNRELKLEEKWQKAGFKDNIIFTWILSENEDICLELLQMILPELNITSIYDIRSEYTTKNSSVFRGVRFDVYVKDVTGRMYDIEMQIANHHDLGKRMSYYQSNLVSRSLKSGQSFVEKVDTYVIFICDFDFGGLGLPKYTTSLILEQTKERVETGEHNIVLNAKAEKFSGTSASLKAFLKFVNNGIPTDSFTEKIEKSIHELKSDTGKKVSFMDYEQNLATERYYARKEGREEGIQEGQEKVLEKAIKKLISKGYNKEKVIEAVADFNDIERDEVEKIYDKMFVK